MPPHLPDAVEVLLPEPIGTGLGSDCPVEKTGKSTLWPVLRGLGIALLGVAWALTAHFTSAGNESSGWGAALALTPMTTALALGLWRLPVRWLGALIGLAVAAGLVGFWPFLKGQVALLYYLEHLGVYILLSAFFGRTLFGPEESLVTRMARSVHGGVLSPAQAAYTRRVTLAWSLFFAGMALMSTLLFLLAPVVVWSTFANLLGGPLIALMFVGEYLWRRRALPEEKPATMAEAVRAWKAQRSNKAP
ncbi:hypothetical protein [Hydrogenophaga sp.]|jgi:uncharacterized membrane protein|uniref:COG4648 family protein n=1 Tax=Hydrogenophaga sp. TaxID=1904254 RepID=UPI002715A95F|nr:hypothetical protein [Hydrogenophaga sp.]MDO9251415.1 hypothetical protein [Hydrogenophaga sp.]MDP3323770.1 hypothetical protein [Hydrogenophaga sp.]MDP3884166.1 hypothetical protein [Hydrogenophaga sp.]